MDLFKSSIQQIVSRISFVMENQLGNEIKFVLATEKIAFMENMMDKFSQKVEDVEGKLEEQAAMMSLVYQLYNHLQIDSFELFFALNNRFEYENLWRFDMKVNANFCIITICQLYNKFNENQKFQIYNFVYPVRRKCIFIGYL